MKSPLRIIPIVILFLVAGQLGCSRRKPVVASANANAPEESNRSTEMDQSQARVFLEQGKEFYRNDQDDKAVEAFEEAIKLDPELAEAHFRLGLGYDAVGKEQEAEGEYKKAVEKYKKYLANNKDPESYYNLGQAYAGLHLYSEAVREYREAAHLKDDDADIFYDLGKALMKLAQYDEAAAAFSKSLEIDPENHRAEEPLEEAREGVQRIKAGKKHQEDLLKKEKEEELKNANGESTQSNASSGSSKSNSNSKANSNSKPKRKRKPGVNGQ
jgi:tetratricopeptide (TPR) repeat protein